MPRLPLFIPQLPEELTAAWLTEILQQRGYLNLGEVQTCEQTMLGDGEGFVGEIIKVDLGLSQPNEDCPESLVAKMPKLTNRAIGELLGAYERENMFYMTYADGLPVAHLSGITVSSIAMRAVRSKREFCVKQTESPAFCRV